MPCELNALPERQSWAGREEFPRRGPEGIDHWGQSPLRNALRQLTASALGRYVLMPYRFWNALSYFRPAISRIPGWVVRSREVSNFSYEVTDRSKDYTAHVVSVVTGSSWNTVRASISDFQQDAKRLREHVARHMAGNADRFVTDSDAKPGRRLLYHAFVRALKPGLIIEAGVHRGLGTCILAAALAKNALEGNAGQVVGLDLNSQAGCLIQPPFSQRTKLVFGDVRDYLQHRIHGEIDLYIHDTANDASLEAAEYSLVERHLSHQAVILSTWHSDVLMEFARRTDREYLVFHDEPLNSWYPGASMGIAFRPSHSSQSS